MEFPVFSKCIILCVYEDMIYFKKKNYLFSFSLSLKIEQKLVKLPITFLSQIILNVPILRRLLRFEFHTELLLGERPLLVILFRSIVYEIDLTNNGINFSKRFPLRGKYPLNSETVKNLKGFDDGIYYGEYFSNHDKESVSIYRFDTNFEHVFQFKAGEINHIHAIIKDHYRNCLWIMAGDSGNGASIWMAKNNFNNVECVYRGEQKFRACFGFVFKEGLLYPTDSPNEINSLRFIKIKDNLFENIEICKLNGPSIYGVRLKNLYIFSTATEEEYSKKIKKLNLLKIKPAKGILKNESQLIMIDEKLNVSIICKAHKDLLPYGLFQFGTFKFPRYINVNHNLLYFYSIGNDFKDYRVMELYLDQKGNV